MKADFEIRIEIASPIEIRTIEYIKLSAFEIFDTFKFDNENIPADIKNIATQYNHELSYLNVDKNAMSVNKNTPVGFIMSISLSIN